MSNNDRLRGIEERAKALGWTWTVRSKDLGDYDMGCGDFWFAFYASNAGLTAAERLLACWEPGAVVKIAPHKGMCRDEAFESCPYYGDWPHCCGIELGSDGDWCEGEYESQKPTCNCPGAGRYKLVRCDDE